MCHCLFIRANFFVSCFRFFFFLLSFLIFFFCSVFFFCSLLLRSFFLNFLWFRFCFVNPHGKDRKRGDPEHPQNHFEARKFHLLFHLIDAPRCFHFLLPRSPKEDPPRPPKDPPEPPRTCQVASRETPKSQHSTHIRKKQYLLVFLRLSL